jgi:hypothetical protein
MSQNKPEQRVISVGPRGEASIQEAELEQWLELPQLSQNASPDEVIFLTHIMSLKTAALIHLGLIAEYGEEEVDLETAKQIIDTLEVLSKRTQGHLSFEENKHLEASIKDLKMAYLSVKD